jgi:DNA-binding transcriptional LysR family regulator
MIDGGHYAELTAFMAVYETRSFRSAALRLGVTSSALSRTLGRLETRLGVRLLNRTTRSVSPTETGQMLHAKLLPAISSLEEAVDEAVAMQAEATGTVRLNLPKLAAELILMPRLAQFTAKYPRIRLDLVIDDGLTDIVSKGFDAGIRIGERLAKDMIAVRLTDAYRIAVVGSPRYFVEHEPPSTPYDLSTHACINYKWTSTNHLGRWLFDGKAGPFEVDVSGPIILNDTGLIRDAAIAGIGLACLPEAAVRAHIKAGQLKRVLEDWCKPFPGFYLYHPSRRQTPPALRALINFLQASFSTTQASGSLR